MIHSKKNFPAEYNALNSAIFRCYNKKSKSYNQYGGRGIIVCNEWIGSLDRFIESVGYRPSGDHSLDRIDVNGNYEPGNCKWSTRSEQQSNKTCNIKLTIDGETKTAKQWSRHPECTVTYITVLRRKKTGWSDFDSVFSKRKTSFKEFKNKKEKIVIIGGIERNMSDWARHLGINYQTFVSRVKKGFYQCQK